MIGLSRAGGRRLFAIVTAVGLAAFAASGARADERVERAREHYLQGNAYYKLDKFQEALAEYEQAYIAKPDPSFLFNIAQCHRLMGNRAEAVKFYRRYLADQPGSPNRPVAEKHIRDLEAAPGPAPTPSAAPPVSARRTADPVPAQSPAGVAPLLAPTPGPSSVAASSPALALEQPGGREPDRPVYRRWWFWTAVAGAAVALTAVAIVAAAAGEPCDSGRVCM